MNFKIQGILVKWTTTEQSVYIGVGAIRRMMTKVIFWEKDWMDLSRALTASKNVTLDLLCENQVND